MINAINDIIKCVSELYFIVGIVLLFTLYFFKKELFYSFFLIIVVFAIERAMFSSNASRYYTSFLFVFFMIIVFQIKQIKKNMNYSQAFLCVICFCLLLAVFYNSIKCFHSFRNIYVFDMKESVERKISTSDDTTVFLDKKEFNRLYIPTKRASEQKGLSGFPTNEEELNTLFSRYDSWKNDAILYSSTPNFYKEIVEFQLNDSIFTLKKIENYITYNKKSYSAYHLDTFQPLVFSCSELRSNPVLNDVLENGIIKSCSPGYDAYIFQLNNKLFWFLGKPIDKSTEIIFHLKTNRPDLLPLGRVAYQFDNRGFRVGSSCEIGMFGHYRVFAKDIPTEYPITEVAVGLGIDGHPVWFNPFQVSVN